MPSYAQETAPTSPTTPSDSTPSQNTPEASTATPGEPAAMPSAADPAPAADVADAPADDPAAEPTALSPLTPPAELAIDDYSLLELLDMRLDGPVVTGTGLSTGARLSQAPVSIITVTREDIANNDWRSLAEILTHVSGLYVADDLVTAAISVRGVTGGINSGTRIVRVMINGTPVSFRPDLTAFLGPEYLPVTAMERVEIARGPLSALFGANAFLATVNVITRRPENGVHAIVTGRAGHLGTGASGGASLLASYGTERIGLLIAASADHLNRSGLRLQRTFPRQSEPITPFDRYFTVETEHDLAKPKSLFGQLQLRSDALGILTFEGGVQQHDSVGALQTNSLGVDRNRSSISNHWVTGAYRQQILGLWGTLEAGWSQGAPTHDDIVALEGNPQNFRRKFDYRATEVAASLEGTIWELSFTGGLDYSHEQHRLLFYEDAAGFQLIGPDDPRRMTLGTFGVNLQVGWEPSFLKGLTITGNARVDHPSQFDTEASWRLAIVYGWSDDVVSKLIVGRAFQTPSAVLLGAQPGFGVTNIVGNRVTTLFPPIEPQSVLSAEVVTSVRIKEVANLEVVAYAQRLDDKIEFAPFGQNFIARNTSREEHLGVELTLRAAWEIVSPYASGTANWGLTPKDRENSIFSGTGIDNCRTAATGSPSASTMAPSPICQPSIYPQYAALVGTDVDLRDFHVRLNANLRWVGPRGASAANIIGYNQRRPYDLPAYTVVNFTLSSRDLFLVDDERETVFRFSLKNAFNERYSEPGAGGFDIPALGRQVWLVVEQRL